MNVVFFGTSDFGLAALDALHAKHTVLAVVTTPDKPSGRKLQLTPSPVKEHAVSLGLPVLDHPKASPGPLLSQLKEMRADVFVVVSFGCLLNSDFLTATRHGSLNIHASLLPKYRGASPMQSAILAGETKTGVSVMRMIERLDAGDVQLQKTVEIGPEEDVLSLKGRLSALGAEAILEALDQLERATAKWTVQDDRVASYAKKIKKEDGRIDWAKEAKEVHAGIRAFLGWPGSFTFFEKKRLLVLKARMASRSGQPGVVLDAGEDGLVVACGKEALSIQKLQLEGKKAMSWTEFRRGCPISPGARFE